MKYIQLSNICLFLIAVILPLYHREGFVMIGDRKYLFFLTVSVLLAISFIIDSIRQQLKGTFQTTSFDGAAIFYGVAVLVSTYFSAYPKTAIWGYSDWHMGMVSQLLFLIIFAAASRLPKNSEWLIKWMLRSALLVFLLALLNRFSVDPLNMFTGMEYWNRTHLLSTIGNMNWYSGYMILMFSIGYCGYLIVPSAVNAENTGNIEKKGIINNLKRLRHGRLIEHILFLGIGYATILTQGSESGLIAGGVLLFASLLYGIFSKQHEIMIRIQNSYILLGSTGLVLSIISVALPGICNFAVESVTLRILRPEYWIALLIVFLVFRILLVKSRVDLVMGAMLTIGILSIIVLARNGRALIDEWGSGRSELWKVAWQSYMEMPIKNQLFGVGPDCFAPYLYEKLPEQMNMILNGWWGDAVIANAHNELLNRLICTGLIGCIGYFWLVLKAVILFLQNRNKNQYLVPIAIGLIVTMVHQFAGFQHVMLTPFVFLVMGMGGSWMKTNHLFKVQ